MAAVEQDDGLAGADVAGQGNGGAVFNLQFEIWKPVSGLEFGTHDRVLDMSRTTNSTAYRLAMAWRGFRADNTGALMTHSRKPDTPALAPLAVIIPLRVLFRYWRHGNIAPIG